MIHQTAVVHEDADIAEDVEIGPFSIVGPGVKIGKGTWVGSHVVIKGPTVIGERNKIYQYCSIGECPQHAGYKGEPTELIIGDDNVFREFCTFNRGSTEGIGKTVVGRGNFFMAYVHVAHDCIIGDETIFANCASLAGHVEVGDKAILGGFSGVHQFCKLGPLVMIGAASICLSDVPPYVMAHGNPAKPYGLNMRGLKRRGFDADLRHSLKKVYKTVYRSDLRIEEAMEELAELIDKYQEVKLFTDFIGSSKRGIIR